MIRLLDLLSLAGIKMERYKIHCATPSASSPLDAFNDGSFKQWQENQNQRNFECDQILSLIQIKRDQWLFAGVYTVDGVQPRLTEAKPGFLYATSEMLGLDHLVGRAVIRFEKDFRQSYLLGDSYGEKLFVIELRRERLSVGDFPGYNGVLISQQTLKTIFREEIPSWKSALSIVSGVYLIIDQTNGKQYVGSASGLGGIWQRWADYAENSHGENKELVALLKEKGPTYSDNFQYAVLEVSDLYTGQQTVLERESHWKKVLCSGIHGYN